MAKIAALVMERRYAARFESLKSRLRSAMTLAHPALVDEQAYTGRDSLCYLLRVGPDPVNTCTQPVTDGSWRGLMCGYYLPVERRISHLPDSADSVTTLYRDLSGSGVAALPKADGVFAYARWNSENETLEAGVDKLGMRPLHWSKIPGGYVVASDLKAAIVVQEKPIANFEAWEERLAFGYPLGEHTLVEGVQRFAEAEVIRFSTATHSSETYEDFFGTISIRPYRIEEFLEEQRVLFDDAMRRLTGLYCGGPTMLTLSGGYDSRRILAWLLDQGIRPDVFTVPEVKSDGSECESGIVERLCRESGLEGWRVYPKTAADRALVRRCRNLITDFQSEDHLFCATLALALKPIQKPNFDGIGGDVGIGALYIEPRYLEPDGDEAFLRDFLPGASNGLMPQAQKARLKERCLDLLGRGDSPNRFTYFIISQRTRRKISLASQTYQATVMESLCPYLDRQFLRQSLSLHPRDKIDAQLQGRLIGDFKHDFAGIPTTHATRAELSAGYLSRFPPIERQEERRLLRDVLFASSSGKRRVSAVQKARFLAGLLLAARLGEDWLHWEVDKANNIQALVQFDRAIESADTYMENVETLADVLGSKTDFLTRME